MACGNLKLGKHKAETLFAFGTKGHHFINFIDTYFLYKLYRGKCAPTFRNNVILKKDLCPYWFCPCLVREKHGHSNEMNLISIFSVLWL